MERYHARIAGNYMTAILHVPPSAASLSPYLKRTFCLGSFGIPLMNTDDRVGKASDLWMSGLFWKFATCMTRLSKTLKRYYSLKKRFSRYWPSSIERR